MGTNSNSDQSRLSQTSAEDNSSAADQPTGDSLGNPASPNAPDHKPVGEEWSFTIHSEDAHRLKDGFPYKLAIAFVIGVASVHIAAYELWQLARYSLYAIVPLWLIGAIGFFWLASNAFQRMYSERTSSWKASWSWLLIFGGLIIAFGIHDGCKWAITSALTNALETENASPENVSEPEKVASHRPPSGIQFVSANWTSAQTGSGQVLAASDSSKSNSPLVPCLMLTLFSVVGWFALRTYHQEHHRLSLRRLNQDTIRLGKKAGENQCVKHLILPLSIPYPVPQFNPQTGKIEFQKDGEHISLDGDDLAKDIVALDTIRPNWQQLMRSIYPHIETLESIWVLGSAGQTKRDETTAAGSAPHMETACQLLKPYLPENTKLLRCVQDQPTANKDENVSLDFRSLIQMECVFAQIVAEISARYPSPNKRNIAIDVTGGPKTASVAGATITFDYDVLFQYIETGTPVDPPENIRFYDVKYGTFELH